MTNHNQHLEPCPYCGSTDLRVTDRLICTDDGELDGVECLNCDALNRLEYWNTRRTSAVGGNPYTLTYTGKEITLLDPRPEQIDIIDIARGLSHTCRYAGMTKTFYSVAQHSVHVAARSRPEHRLQALFHDAAEACLGDVPAPIKPHMPGYKKMEARLHRVICERFNIPADIPEHVLEIDRRIIADEASALMPAHTAWLDNEPLGIDILPWAANTAMHIWLEYVRQAAEHAGCTISTRKAA